ncbi:MAG: carotenoid 1,2-hydratase, partial [Candidatus Eremiobacteraeota bacterium]|nr:carotenoid 1,2-hydratase [Candidatus Eremiobacteraeota bacterium]
LWGSGRHRYGFELTIFRFGVQRPLRGGSAWDINNLYFAHYAISDIEKSRFRYFQRVGRAALAYAGAKSGDENAWIGSWRVRRHADSSHEVHAAGGEMELRLKLRPLKRPAIHGRDGVSRKGECRSCSSHYYSFTRLEARGTLRDSGSDVAVKGVAWSDHEWSSSKLERGVVGWDWFSMQLSDKVDIMLYRLRRADGTSVPQSSGTLDESDGTTRHLALSDFSVAALGRWQSPRSAAAYPSGWRIRLPRYGALLEVKPLILDQELATQRSTGTDYWEGACEIAGTFRGHRVSGVGYTELTGYAKAASNGLR